jgi:CDGSH-type Zn-finger protein
MREEDKQELRKDLEKFIDMVDRNPCIALTMTIQARQNKLCGCGIEVNKPAGKGISFEFEG